MRVVSQRPFCSTVSEWLEASPEAVVAIHCKAGKGRTGVMACALLLHMGQAASAADALALFAPQLSPKP